jgi:hypothetical protein
MYDARAAPFLDIVSPSFRYMVHGTCGNDMCQTYSKYKYRLPVTRVPYSERNASGYLRSGMKFVTSLLGCGEAERV